MFRRNQRKTLSMVALSMLQAGASIKWCHFPPLWMFRVLPLHPATEQGPAQPQGTEEFR